MSPSSTQVGRGVRPQRDQMFGPASANSASDLDQMCHPRFFKQALRPAFQEVLRGPGAEHARKIRGISFLPWVRWIPHRSTTRGRSNSGKKPVDSCPPKHADDLGTIAGGQLLLGAIRSIGRGAMRGPKSGGRIARGSAPKSAPRARNLTRSGATGATFRQETGSGAAERLELVSLRKVAPILGQIPGESSLRIRAAPWRPPVDLQSRGPKLPPLGFPTNDQDGFSRTKSALRGRDGAAPHTGGGGSGCCPRHRRSEGDKAGPVGRTPRGRGGP